MMFLVPVKVPVNGFTLLEIQRTELLTGFVRQALIWPTYGVRDENGVPALPAGPQVLLRAQRDGAAGKFMYVRQPLVSAP
jgi:hypothetical protein